MPGPNANGFASQWNIDLNVILVKIVRDNEFIGKLKLENWVKSLVAFGTFPNLKNTLTMAQTAEHV